MGYDLIWLLPAILLKDDAVSFARGLRKPIKPADWDRNNGLNTSDIY